MFAMNVEPKKLLKFILETGLITEAQSKSVLEKSKGSDQSVGEVLVADGLMSQKELIKIEAYLLGIPFINLEAEAIPPDVLNIIPESIARAHNIVAFRKKDNNLEVAMVDPEDLRTIEFVKKTIPDVKILARLTTRESIKSVLSQYQKTLENEFKEILDQEDIKHIQEFKATGGKDESKKAAEDVPIIKIVDTLMKHAILQNTSDVHIEPLEKEVVVRYRIDGILRDVVILPITAALGVVARIKVLSNLKLDEHRLPQDGRFKIETEDFKYSVRVSILPVFNGEKIVMRLLPENTKSISLEKLGFTGKSLKQIQDNLAKASRNDFDYRTHRIRKNHHTVFDDGNS
jgi:type IV pilus assembly protein PilB